MAVKYKFLEGITEADYAFEAYGKTLNEVFANAALAMTSTMVELNTIKQKIEKIATDIYGADGVIYEPQANQQIKSFEQAGLGNLPICMAKTHLSISHEASWKGRPKGFTVPVREVRASAGAGFIYPLLGTMRTMPGLSSVPAYTKVDIDFETGKIVGLF